MISFIYYLTAVEEGLSPGDRIKKISYAVGLISIPFIFSIIAVSFKTRFLQIIFGVLAIFLLFSTFKSAYTTRIHIFDLEGKKFKEGCVAHLEKSNGAKETYIEICSEYANLYTSCRKYNHTSKFCANFIREKVTEEFNSQLQFVAKDAFQINPSKSEASVSDNEQQELKDRDAVLGNHRTISPGVCKSDCVNGYKSAYFL